MSKDRRGIVLAYVGVALLLLPFPLFGILHVEASAVVAAAAFLISALATVRDGLPRMKGWAKLVLPAFVPAVLLLLSMLWRPNCGWLLGLFLYLLFVMPSVVLGAGVGAVTGAIAKRFRVAIIIGVWLSLLVVPALLTLKNHPQFFVYNAVFGSVLGPIYDDELSLRAGFFWHRLRTFLWAVWLIFFVRWRAASQWPRREAMGTIVVTVILGMMHLFQGQLGIVQTEERIADTLGATHQSASLVVHFDSLSLMRQDAALIAREQEYRLEQIATTLELDQGMQERPIHVFIYPDEETKGHLTGARRTGVAPVWLEIPQVHVLQNQIRATLTHELVHVRARSFGQPWIGASWSLGLVEGLGAAFEPPQAYPELDEQVVAAVQPFEDGPALLESPADAVVSMMTPWRFWTSRPAMAYAVQGAFTSYLLETYGADPLKQSYRTTSFQKAYGRTLGSLATEWVEAISDTRADSSTVVWVRWVFSRPSVFELRCPHYVPRWVRRAREAADLRSEGQFRKALTILQDLREERAGDAKIAAQWAGAALADSVSPDSVADELDAFPDSLVSALLLVREGDARRMAGRNDAETAYDQAIEESSPFPASTRAFIRLRSKLGPEGLHLVLKAIDDDQSQLAIARELERLPNAGVFAASLYATAGRYTEAWDTYRRSQEPALPSDEQDAVALHAIEWAIAADRLDEAEVEVERILAERVSEADPLAMLASDRLNYIRWLRDR